MVKNVKVTETSSTAKTVVYVDDPPDGGWGWVVVVAAHFALLFSQGSLTGFGPFAIRLREYFKTGAGEIAGVSGTALFVTLATGPISSALNSCCGCRIVVVIGGIIATLGTITSSFATRVSHLYIAYGVVTGFGYGLVATPSIAFIARYFNKRYALANGMVFSAFAVGWIALPQLYQIFLDNYGWRNAMLFLAALNFLICLCGTCFRPPPQKSVCSPRPAPVDISQLLEQLFNRNPYTPAVGFETNKTKTNRRQRTFSEILLTFKNNRCLKLMSKIIDVTLFCDPNFVLMATVYFIIAIGFYPTILFLVARAESFGIPYPLPTTLMTITGSVSLLGRTGHGFVIDVGAMTPVRATASSLLVCGLVNVLSVFVKQYIGLACIYGVFGLANGIYHPLLAVTLKHFVGVEKFPVALGICNLCHGLGALIGPPIAGRILDQSQNYNFCYLFTGVILCLSATILFASPYITEKCGVQRRGRGKLPRSNTEMLDEVEVVVEIVTSL